jgi:hypothetical protein
MADEKWNEAAYRDERRRIARMSDSDSARRRAQLEETIDLTMRQFIESLDASVKAGEMTAEQAADEFAAFQQDLRQLRRPTEPS